MKIIQQSHNIHLGETIYRFLVQVDIKKYIHESLLQDDFNFISDHLTITIHDGLFDFPAVNIDEYVEDVDMSKQSIEESIQLVYDMDGITIPCDCVCDMEFNDGFNEIRITDMDEYDIQFFIVHDNTQHKISWHDFIKLWLCQLKWKKIGFLYNEYAENSDIIYDCCHKMLCIEYYDDARFSNNDIYDTFLMHIDMEGFLIDC